MYQFGPARIVNPQCAGADLAEMPFGRAFLAVDTHMVNRGFLFAFDLKAFIVGAEVNRKPASARGFAANRAIA
jgi:hypothetical protein